jgi:hypothetical protein
MATKLEKDVTRESTVEYNDRNIHVTLTKDQEVSMKLKGMKTGTVSIGIEDLYKQLVGDDSEAPKEEKKGPVSVYTEKSQKKEKNYNNSPMINLYDLRSLSAVTAMDYKTKVLFDSIINDLIKRNK